jgi:hypothetical protein
LADVTTGRTCERKSWEDQLEKGAAYIGDRYYSKNYQLFGKLAKKGCACVLRLAEEATITILEPIEVTAADRQCCFGKDAGRELVGAGRVRGRKP